MRIELENYDDVMDFIRLVNAQWIDQALRPQGLVVPVDGTAVGEDEVLHQSVVNVQNSAPAGAAGAAPTEAETEAEAKPKRKRRARAEIEADKAQAAEPEPPEPPEQSTVNTGNPFAQTAEEKPAPEEAQAFGNDELSAAARAKAGNYPPDRLAHMSECRNYIQLKGVEAYTRLTEGLGAGNNVIAFDDATISAHRALLALSLEN